jgi:rod shape-determining protein MreC
MKVSSFFETISEIKRLKKENEELKIKNQELMSQIANLVELKKENEILREALALGLEKEFKVSLAQITGKDISQDFILINKGSENGIVENMPVITSQKILVGKIYKVYKNYSRVMLITNKENSFGGKIVGKEILAEVSGRGNLKIIFDLIPSEKEISEGDLVETTVLGGIFPKGLLVGKIGKIQKSDVQSFYQAEISPFFDINKLENVFIILNF